MKALAYCFMVVGVGTLLIGIIATATTKPSSDAERLRRCYDLALCGGTAR